jgi:predicted RNA-binding protein with PUA domain
MWHLAPELPGRRTLWQKRKSVATKKRSAAVVRNENAVVDSLCDTTI